MFDSITKEEIKEAILNHCMGGNYWQEFEITSLDDIINDIETIVINKDSWKGQDDRMSGCVLEQKRDWRATE